MAQRSESGTNSMNYFFSAGLTRSSSSSGTLPMAK
jgi:hypothetical protein